MSPPFRPISFIDSRYTDGDGLTKPEAHVVQEDPAAGGDSLAQTLLDHCKAGFAPYKYPRWFRFVDELAAHIHRQGPALQAPRGCPITPTAASAPRHGRRICSSSSAASSVITLPRAAIPDKRSGHLTTRAE